MKAGSAAFINLNPIEEHKFVLIVAAGDMVEMPETSPDFEKTVRGWFRPHCSVADFLSVYSEAGGGHHGAGIYNPDMLALRTFARIMDWGIVEI